MSPVLKAGPVSRARYEALRILVRVEQDRAFADIALEHALEEAKLDPRDAGLCTEIVYGTLRWRRHLDWRLGPHLKRPLAKLDPWVRSLLRLAAYQLFFLDRVPHWAAVDEAVSLARLKARTPGPAEFVNAVLRALTRAGTPPPLPALPVEALATRLSFPDWLASRWIARYGPAETEALMTAMNERPPVTVRANALRVSREDLARRLRDEELAETRPTALAPEGLAVLRGSVAQWSAARVRWKARCDHALVDAPCSNLGVLRRNPEVKWRRMQDDLARLPEKQHGILTAAASLVRPGGRLVYATCSLEPEENEGVVAAFLEQHVGWRVDSPADFPVAPDPGGFIRCVPHVHGTDGFTAIRLRRHSRGG